MIIDGNMNLSVMINQLTGVNVGLDDSITSLALQLMAPSTTSFSVAPSGATRIGGAGPFSISLDVLNTSNESSNTFFQANSGDCFFELTGEDNEFVTPGADQCE